MSYAVKDKCVRLGTFWYWYRNLKLLEVDRNSDIAYDAF